MELSGVPFRDGRWSSVLKTIFLRGPVGQLASSEYFCGKSFWSGSRPELYQIYLDAWHDRRDGGNAVFEWN